MDAGPVVVHLELAYPGLDGFALEFAAPGVLAAAAVGLDLAYHHHVAVAFAHQFQPDAPFFAVPGGARRRGRRGRRVARRLVVVEHSKPGGRPAIAAATVGELRHCPGHRSATLFGPFAAAAGRVPHVETRRGHFAQPVRLLLQQVAGTGSGGPAPRRRRRRRR